MWTILSDIDFPDDYKELYTARTFINHGSNEFPLTFIEVKKEAELHDSFKKAKLSKKEIHS